MCTYNGERFLREQMDSILAQTYPIHEIIISDDCSTDGTMDILREYAAKHTFIKIHQNARNKGCNQNFHDTFKFVSKETDYIAISDQDDIWFPEKVEKLIQSKRKKDTTCASLTLYLPQLALISKPKTTSHCLSPQSLCFLETIYRGTPCL